MLLIAAHISPRIIFNPGLKSLGCYTVFTAPQHPCSNDQAENFIRTLKTAVRASDPHNYDELNSCIDSFLLQYRNAVHPTTEKTPAMLFKGRNLRSSANLDTIEVIFYRGTNSRPCDGIVLGAKGAHMFSILDCADGSVHQRHYDQINISSQVSEGNKERSDSPTRFTDDCSLQSVDASERFIPPASQNTNDQSRDQGETTPSVETLSESITMTPGLRRSRRLKGLSPIKS